MNIAILGGANLAQALGKLGQSAGHQVIFGVRDPQKVVAETDFSAVAMDAALTSADIVIIAIPYRVCDDVLPPLADMLKGKIVIDATNPLNEDYSPILLGDKSSAGEEIARVLPGARVVKAFNMVFADIMSPKGRMRGDERASVMVAGDDETARRAVVHLVRAFGFQPEDAGPLKFARYMEAMAHLNIQLAFGMGGGSDAAFIYHRRSA
ncbi:MAG: NAD(P)-binding domain-containing protein [Pseudomonadota bacterium]